MFAGLRIGEALALKWENVNFENKTLKVERAITQIPKFDYDGKVISRVTVIADTKTLAVSVRFQLQTLLLKRSNVGEKNKLKGKIQIQMLRLT